MKNPYELTKSEQIVDVRPWGVRTAEALADPINFAMAAMALAAAALMFPLLMPIWIVIALVAVISSSSVGMVLPFRYPPSANDPTSKKKGNGILFLGNLSFAPKKENRLPLENVVDKFKEAWLSDDDLRKHFLILGSTGSGKSELLKAIFFNALCWGSGFFVADGKADNKLPLDNYALARWFGRDDDILTLNFLLAGKTPKQVRLLRRRRTNKTNPFSTADSDTTIQMGANLLPKVDGDAKNWQEKALNCWRGLVPALYWLRDEEGWEISVRHFVDFLALSKLEWLYAKGYDVAYRRDGEWPEEFEGLKAYLEVGLPGFKLELALKKYHGKDGFSYPLPDAPAPTGPGGRPQQGNDQTSQVYEQHGYRATQLNPALNLLDKTYGHIFADKFSEIDMVDVTLNNRILNMLIPSLEKSAQEAESLGKLNVAVLKVMMGKNLGAEIEGHVSKIADSKATEANYPYIVALDELGYYFADGIAVMFAQARSLGFSMIAAAQDIEKLTEGSKAAEAGAMLANQVSKVFMRIDDANKTNEMIQKYLDKVTVALRKSYEWNDTTGFRRVPEVSIEEVSPITLKNLQSMQPGYGVINTMGMTVKLKTLYVGDFLKKYKREWFHINRFLQVRSLTKEEVMENSVPMDVINDPYVKGYRLLERLRGAQEVPDLESIVDGKSYEEQWRHSAGLAQYVASVAANLPSGIHGAQRAMHLFEAARHYLEITGKLPSGGVAGSGPAGRSSGGPAARLKPAADGAEALVAAGGSSGASGAPDTPDAPGRLIEAGSGSGDLAAPLRTDDDPFAFLNDDCPLERRPAGDIMGQSSASPAANASMVLQTSLEPVQPVVQVLRDDANQALETNSALLVAAPTIIQTKLDEVLAGALVFDPSGTTGAKAFVPRKVDTANDWISQALLSAGDVVAKAAARKETLVGVTDETRDALSRLEQALGNPEPMAAAATIERIVAEQATPPAMEADPVDMSDIDMLLKQIDQAGGGH